MNANWLEEENRDVLILRPHWLVEETRDIFEFCNHGCVVEKENVMLFWFLQHSRLQKEKNLMFWMNATWLFCRQTKRDVFWWNTYGFFFISKIDICDKWKQHHAKLKYGFFFFWFFIIYQLKIWWCFWRDRFGKRDVFIVILWKNAIVLVSEFEQKIKFVLFWRKSQSFRKVFRRKCDYFYCKTRDGFDTAICVFPFFSFQNSSLLSHVLAEK